MSTTAAFLNDLRDRCHEMSKSKGFYDTAPDVGDNNWVDYDAMKIALMHSELSEALEEIRDDVTPNHLYYRDADGRTTYAPSHDGHLNKPEGVPAELADVIIRVLDYAGFRGIDLGQALEEKLSFNATRGRLHGKQF